MNNKLALFLETREDAFHRQDWSVVMAMNAELQRVGYKDPESVLDRHEMAPETMQATEVLERAVPERPKRGRPPRPRCEHGMLVERCPTCNEDEAVE